MQTSGGAYARLNDTDEFGRIWKGGSYIGGVVRTEDDMKAPLLYLPQKFLVESTIRYFRIFCRSDLFLDLSVEKIKSKEEGK